MKKAMVIIGLLSLTAVSAFAQYGKWYNDNNYAYGKHDHDDHFGGRRGNDYHWAYDRDFNVVRGGRAMEINSYQRQAQMRINEGIKRGLITRGEANRLMTYYENIERKENRFLRNGRISRSEANELERDLAHLNRLIARESRDFERNRYNRS